MLVSPLDIQDVDQAQAVPPAEAAKTVTLTIEDLEKFANDLLKRARSLIGAGYQSKTTIRSIEWTSLRAPGGTARDGMKGTFKVDYCAYEPFDG